MALVSSSNICCASAAALRRAGPPFGTGPAGLPSDHPDGEPAPNDAGVPPAAARNARPMERRWLSVTRRGGSLLPLDKPNSGLSTDTAETSAGEGEPPKEGGLRAPKLPESNEMFAWSRTAEELEPLRRVRSIIDTSVLPPPSTDDPALATKARSNIDGIADEASEAPLRSSSREASPSSPLRASGSGEPSVVGGAAAQRGMTTAATAAAAEAACARWGTGEPMRR
mmetsp:Transcript_164136/g.521949  ORF Transcript_164136/g.521949 Transcript_164136/m.521949 type:complete len:226 (+) Transcript_164136:902-1579(+)